jgi:hypothetical protein
MQSLNPHSVSPKSRDKGGAAPCLMTLQSQSSYPYVDRPSAPL